MCLHVTKNIAFSLDFYFSLVNWVLWRSWGEREMTKDMERNIFIKIIRHCNIYIEKGSSLFSNQEI